MASTYKWTTRLSILTPILVIICVLSMGGGHGSYTPTVVLFPWATINTAWQDHLSVPLFIGGMVQFVVYGFLIDKALVAGSRRWTTITIIVLHLILVILILWLRNPEWG